MRAPQRLERIPAVAQIPPRLDRQPHLAAGCMRELVRSDTPVCDAEPARLRARVRPVAAQDVVERGHEARVAVAGVAVAGEDVWERGPEVSEQGFVASCPGGEDDGPGGVQQEVAVDNAGFGVEGAGDGGAEDFYHGGLRVCEG